MIMIMYHVVIAIVLNALNMWLLYSIYSNISPKTVKGKIVIVLVIATSNVLVKLLVR